MLRNLKEKVKGKGKQIVGAFAGALTAMSTGLVAHASSTVTTVTSSDWQSVIDSLTGQISVSTIVAVLASASAVSVGFVFLWFGLRKVIRMIMSAVRGGKLSV